MTKIMIPKCRNPFVVIMNGIRYEYESGKEVEVPDAVAAIIQFHEDSKPKALPIVGGSGPCGLPHVYFSDSADKLPTDAVDGSLAVMPSDSIIGTWRFNETLDFQDLGINNAGSSENTVKLLALEHNLYAGAFDTWKFIRNSSGEIEMYYGHIPAYIDGAWDDDYGDISICSDIRNIGSQDITEGSFKKWLYANATRLSGGYTLYSRENGEWVNQGEVDFTDLASS